MTKDKCKIGYSCGRSCIERSDNCQKNASLGATEVIDNYKKIANPQHRFRGAKLIGGGNFSDAYLTANNTLLKVAKPGEEISPIEKKVSALMGEAGYAPKILSSGKLANGRQFVEMEYLEGYRTAFVKNKEGEWGRVRISDGQHTKIKEALTYLHKSGYAHTDIHGTNIMVNDATGDAKLIDYGLAEPISSSSVSKNTAKMVYKDLDAYEDSIYGTWDKGTPAQEAYKGYRDSYSMADKISYIEDYLEGIK